MDTINKPCHCEPVRRLVWQSPGSSGHHRKNNVIANQSADWCGNPPVLPGALRKGAHWCGPFQGFPPVTIPRYFREPPCNTCHCEPASQRWCGNPPDIQTFLFLNRKLLRSTGGLPHHPAGWFAMTRLLVVPGITGGIATPVCALARNDTLYFPASSQ